MKIKIFNLILLSMFFSLYSFESMADEDYAAQLYKNKKYKAAGKIWNNRAIEGDPLAQFNLGLLFEKGEGFKIDPTLAESWYRRAANAGLGEAQFNLAVLLSKDTPKESLFWFQVIKYQSKDLLSVMATNAFNALSKNFTHLEILEIEKNAQSWINSGNSSLPKFSSKSFQLVGLSQKQVITLQKKLLDSGFMVGPIDGLIGIQTRSALMDWRRANGYKPELDFVPEWLIK
tara:strand:- start:2322 stop:3014 length:693 start_codon:yes stop_codon:yes gene_type:complete